MISKDAKFSRKKDSGMEKCFIYHNRGHFPKVCLKYIKSKRVTQISEKTIDYQFQTKDESLYNLHLDINDIPKYTFNVEKETFEDILKECQPQSFISRYLLDCKDDFSVDECVKGNEDGLQPLIYSPKNKYPSMFKKHFKEPEVSDKNKLTRDLVPERGQEPTIEEKETIALIISQP